MIRYGDRGVVRGVWRKGGIGGGAVRGAAARLARVVGTINPSPTIPISVDRPTPTTAKTYSADRNRSIRAGRPCRIRHEGHALPANGMPSHWPPLPPTGTNSWHPREMAGSVTGEEKTPPPHTEGGTRGMSHRHPPFENGMPATQPQ